MGKQTAQAKEVYYNCDDHIPISSIFWVCAGDVIKFSNPKLKSHQMFYPYQA